MTSLDIDMADFFPEGFCTDLAIVALGTGAYILEKKETFSKMPREVSNFLDHILKGQSSPLTRTILYKTLMTTDDLKEYANREDLNPHASRYKDLLVRVEDLNTEDKSYLDKFCDELADAAIQVRGQFSHF